MPNQQTRAKAFIKSLPTKGVIEKKAKLPQGYLSKKYNWTDTTLNKIIKVIQPFGFKP